MPRLGPATPEGKPSGLGFCAFARHYLRNRVCFLLLQVLRCFTSLSVAPTGLSLFIPRRHPIKGAGFPHSEISGSRPVDGSPELFAVCHVLLRLVMPRHPSCARIRLARFTSPLVTLQFSLTSNVRFSRIKPKRCIAPRGAGGGRRIRTDGILLAKQALYQLSYTPVRQMDCRIAGLSDCWIV